MNAPYHDMKLDFRLSLEAGTFDDTVNKPPQVSRIAVAGALFDKDYTLFRDDYATILRALKVLRETHIKLAPIVKFDFYNILAPLNNDFLKAALQHKTAPAVDAVIACGIWGGRSTRNTPERMRPEQINTPPNFSRLYSDITNGYEHNREVSISSLQNIETSWPEAAHVVGAKYVITRGSDNDMDYVNSNHFKPGDFYKVAIATKEHFEHVAYGSLGIMVRRDQLKEIQASVKKSSPLGKRILELTDAPNEKPPVDRGMEDIMAELRAIAEQRGIDLGKFNLKL